MISTHILPDVQATCDDVVILSKGQVRLSESLDTLSRTERPSFSIRVLGEPNGLIASLKKHGFTPRDGIDGCVVVESSDPNLAESIWQSARESNTTIQTLNPARNSLEDIFMATVRESGNKEAINANS